MKKVGNDGVITVEEGTIAGDRARGRRRASSSTAATSRPHFVTNRNKMAVEMEDAYVLISEKKLSSINELLPLLEKVVQTGKPLLIIADDVEGEVMAALVVNKLRGSLKVAAVKAPAYGELRKAMLQDIALMTGGTVISDDLGLKLENVLARCPRARQEGDDRQAEHHDRRRRRQAGRHRGPHRRRSRRSSRARCRLGRPPTTTARSSRSGWPG